MGLFKRKKTAAAPIDPLAVLAAGLGSALKSAVPSSSGGVSVKAGEAEDCRAWLSSSAEPILRLSFHASSSQECAGLFLPASLLSGAPAGPEAAADALGAAWAATFPESHRPAISYCAQVPAGKQSAALWTLLELKAHAVLAAGKEAWLFTDPGLRDSFGSAADGAGAEAATRTSVSIRNTRDFLALDSLLPRLFASGKYRFGAEPESFSFIPGTRACEGIAPPAGQEAAWFLASFDLAQAPGVPARKLSFIYSFHKGALKSQASGADPDGIANALASSLFQESVKEFAAAAKCVPANPSIKRLAQAPDLSKAGSALTVRATVNGQAFRMPFGLTAPGGVILPLLQAWVDAAAVKRLQAVPEALILCLNSRMLSARLPDMLAPPELRKKIPQMLVSELLNLISDSDYDLVLQNCLIASMGSKGLPGLLYYNESVNGADGIVRERILPLGPLDARRLFSHMPEAFRDDYVAFSGQLHANPPALCVSRNVDAMKDIAKAVSGGRIAASARLVWIIREHFLKGIRAQDEAELAALKSKGLPFASLTALEPRLAQKAMTRLDDREAALVLLDSGEKKDVVRKYVSSARMARLDEENAFLRRQYESGETGPEDLLRAKRLLSEACEEVKRIEAQEAQAALERERARMAAPPPPEKGRKRR